MKKAILAGAAVLAFGSTAFAQTVEYNAQLGTASNPTPFYPGSGNTNTNFVINTYDLGNSNSMELAIKAKKRGGPSGSVPSYADGSYSVQPGLDTDGPPASGFDPWWWSFDFSLDMRQSGIDLANLGVQFVFDFENQGQVAGDIVPGSSFAAINGGTPDPRLVQNSWNFGFGFLSALNYDPDAVGTYTIGINVYDLSARSLTPIGGVEMQVVVIPLPGAAGMALAGMGLIGLRRRR